jgi:hypothetical protein
MPFRRIRSATCAVLVLLPAGTLAQATGSDSAMGPRPQPAPQASTPPVFSGVIFGSYQYLLPTTPAPLLVDNQFIVDRAYLTFRMPAGERTSIRITTDVYQTSEATASSFTSNAYTIRAKYAYLQYEGTKAANLAQIVGRVGILQNVLIEHEEQFWLRYISLVPTERAAYFSSADVGIAAQAVLPQRWGELYATIVNGPGYTSRERDRFKDFAARLSLTPFAGRVASPVLGSLTLTAWGYKGATASRYADPATAAGTVGTVGGALDRSRAGVLAGIRDARFTLAAQVAQRHDAGEAGANTVASPRVETAATGRLWSVYGTARPLAFTHPAVKSPFGIVARYDRVSPSVSSDNVATPPAPSNSYHNLIAGIFVDLSSRAQVALNFQEALASNNGVSLAPTPGPQSKGYFAHFVVNF